jgi:ribonuclease III
MSGRQQQLQKLIARLGLPADVTVRWELLDLALTHPSVSATSNYEQLEFVGDAVLRLYVAQWLWTLDATGTVGQWTAIRSVLVSDRTLAEIAYSFGLERYLAVSVSASRDLKGEPSRLANAMEALFAALYLSTGDFALIDPWLSPELEKRAALIRSDPAYQNYKAALQQWTQAHLHVLPEYRVTEIKGNLAPQRFVAEVWINGKCFGSGTGQSRKAAEKDAAEAAYVGLVPTSSAPGQPNDNLIPTPDEVNS